MVNKQLGSFIALVSSENKILTIQRSRLVKHPELWGLPGGRVEDGENIFQGGVREVREEIGIDLDPFKHGHLTFRDGHRWHITLLPWTPTNSEVSQMLELVNGKMVSDEVMAAKWLSVDEIAAMPSRELHTSLKILDLRLQEFNGNLFHLLLST